MKWETGVFLLRIAGRGANVRPFRITIDTDQKVICNSLNEALRVTAVSQYLFHAQIRMAKN